MQRVFSLPSGLVLALLCCACNDCGRGPVGVLENRIEASETRIDFGRVYVGASRGVDVTLSTFSSAEVQGVGFTLEGPNAGDFGAVLPGATTIRAGAPAPLTLQLSPLSAGEKRATLRVTATDFEPVEIALSGTGEDAPECDDENVCTDDAFDFATERCRSRPIAFPLVCDDENACTTESFCADGVCRGVGINCPPPSTDCATALCDAQAGCIEVPNNFACDDGDPCTDDRCELGTGCVSTLALNGTPCGPVGQCDEAYLCADGVCQAFDVPDGSFCVGEGACTTDEQCQAGECVGVPAPQTVGLLAQSATYGADGALVAIADDGRYIFIDRGLTVVDPALTPAERVVSALPSPAANPVALAVVGAHVIVVDETVQNVAEVFSLRLAPSGELSLEGSLRFSLGASLSADANVQGFRLASDADTLVLCEGDRPEMIAFRLTENGPERIAEQRMTQGMTCADVAIRGDRVLLAEQNLRTTSDANIPPAVFSTWTLGDAFVLERILRIDEICDAFSAQPLLAEITADGASLILGCGTGAINPQTRVRAETLLVVDAALPSPTLANAVVVDMLSGRSASELIVDGPNVRVWTEDPYDNVVCSLSLSTLAVEQCGQPYAFTSNRRPHGQVAARAGLVATSADGGIITSPLAQTPRFGSLGQVVAHQGQFFSLSRTAVQRFSFDGEDVQWTGGASLFDVDEPGVFAFGGGVAGPYLVQPRANAAPIYDASQPNAPYLVSRFENVKAPIVGQRKAGGSLPFLAADVVAAPTLEANAIAQFLAPTLSLTGDDLWFESLDGAFLGDRSMQLHAFGDTITATYNSGPSTHHLAIIDVVSEPPLQGVPVLRAILPQNTNLPVATAANGETLVRIRGANIGNGFEVPAEVGRVEWFSMTDAELVPVGTASVPNAVDVLWLEHPFAVISTSDGFTLVEKTNDEDVVVRMRRNLQEEALGAAISNDLLVVTSSHAVHVYSAPCAALGP